MPPPYLFISFTALLLTPGTRKRPPQSGSVQTGMWEITPEKSARVYERVRFTWTMNAQPVLLKNSTKSRPQGRNADYTTAWIPGPIGVSRDVSRGLPVA